MHINLSPEIEHYLQLKVGTGFYSNASEVVRDTIRRMRQEDEKLERLGLLEHPFRQSCAGTITVGCSAK